MFGKYEEDHMYPGPTPERVLAVAKAVYANEFTSKELSVFLSKDENGKSEDIESTVTAAIQLGLIENTNGKLKLAQDKEQYIKNYVVFRRYVSQKVAEDPESVFLKMTGWYIQNGERVFRITDYQRLYAEVNKAGLNGIKDKDILGWRFWFRFLGYGYIYNKTIIPNMCTRIADALSKLEPNTHMDYIMFMNFLKNNIPELAFLNERDTWPIGLSNGLRTLNSLNIVKLEDRADAKHVQLYPLKGDIIEMSDITYLGGELNE